MGITLPPGLKHCVPRQTRRIPAKTLHFGSGSTALGDFAAPCGMVSLRFGTNRPFWENLATAPRSKFPQHTIQPQTQQNHIAASLLHGCRTRPAGRPACSPALSARPPVRPPARPSARPSARPPAPALHRLSQQYPSHQGCAQRRFCPSRGPSRGVLPSNPTRLRFTQPNDPGLTHDTQLGGDTRHPCSPPRPISAVVMSA